MSDPVADLFRAAQGTTLVKARPVDSVLPRRKEVGSPPRNSRRSLVVVTAVALVVTGTGLVVNRAVGNGAVQTTPPALSTMAPSAAASEGPSVAATSSVTGTEAPPPGFIEPPDLGTGHWTASPSETTVRGVGVDLVTCDGAPRHLPVSGQQQWYRGITTEGGEWVLTENLAALDTGDFSEVDALLKAMRTCPGVFNMSLLAANDQIMVFGQLLPSGAVGNAATFGLLHGQYLTLTSTPGAGNLGSPGQTQWLIDVTRRALERATGVAVEPPRPNALALAAASKYRPDPGAVVYYPNPDLVPGAPASPPEHMLNPSELSAVWHFSIADPRDHERSHVTTADLPTCGASTTSYKGPTESQNYRGFSGTTDPDRKEVWFIGESVTTLTKADAARARRQLAALASCPSLTFGAPAMTVVASPTGSVIGTVKDAGGAPTQTSIFIVVSDRLVSLVLVHKADDGRMPGGAAWLAQVAEAARRAAQ